MKRRTALLIWSALLTGCVGEVGAPADPNEKVATLVYVADGSAALVATQCQKPLDCRLANQHLCRRLTVEVFGSGKTVGICTLQHGTTLMLDGAKDGVPLKCRSHTGRYAVHCLDSNNNVAVDGTELQVAVYPTREPSWYRPAIGNGVLGDGAGYLTEDTPSDQPPTDQPPTDQQQPQQPQQPEQNPEQPQTGSGNPQLDADCRNKAINAFNQSFQNVINKEGLTGIHYQPGVVPNTSGFNGGSYQNDAQACQVQMPQCKTKSHWSQWLGGGGGMQWYGGGCYCSVTDYGPSCYTSLIITAAKATACNSKPQECDATVWSTGVQDATVPAKQFVDQTNTQTDTTAGVVEGINAGLSLLSLLGSIGSFGGTNNYGSPLVLDLAGDGIALSSTAGGVAFDITGSGSRQTAWVEGKDDALLAIDLDANGRIDDGTELFGEASRVSDFAGGDGFGALAALDRPQSGGNGNGLVESGDMMFDRLLLWRDSNRDGVSQPSELSTLQSAGIEALSVSVESDTSVFDAHGNDLSSRSSFLRSDGTGGLMVDVYFLMR